MARLEAQSKLLYYPTPEAIARQIGTHFTANAPVRLADPCAGTGAALLAFAAGAQLMDVETWGVELSYSRARTAMQALDKVLPASFYRVKWSNRSVSLGFDNPPYDWSEFTDVRTQKRIRHEVLFLEGLTPRITPDGHQALIVPRWLLGLENAARHLLGYYAQVRVARFPDGEYERFKQVVVFACYKRPAYQTPGAEAVKALTTLADESIPMDLLSDGQHEYPIPETPAGKHSFTYKPVEPLNQLRAAARVGLTRSDAYRRAAHVPPLGAPFHPAMPLSVGHITMLLSSQQAGVLRIQDESGQACLLKGMSVKVVTRTQEEAEDDQQTINERESFASSMALADASGAARLLTTPDEIGALVGQYAAQLGEAVLQKNFPLYHNDPSPHEWELSGRVALGLPPLPGRTQRGLFPLQRAMSIAAARTARRHGAAILNAEPGFGKTAASTGALMLLDKWPAVVVAPGHMLWKWFRELESASDPASPLKARVITRPARPAPKLDFSGTAYAGLSSPLFHPAYQPGWITERFETALQAEYWWPRVRRKFSEAGAEIVESERYQVEAVCEADTGLRRRLRLKVNSAADLARTLKLIDSLTLTSQGKRVRPLTEVDGLEIITLLPDRDDYSLADFLADYKSGRLGGKAVAVCGFEAAKYDAGDDPAARLPVRRFRDDSGKLVRAQTCPSCGAPAHGRFCQAEIQRPVRNATGGLVFEEDGRLAVETRPCGAPLFQFSRWRRAGLARLAQRKYAHVFKVYAADEVHKAKSGDTDIGAADQRLLSATRYSLALTGTLFGGNSSSLFHLLYRRSADVRRLYAHDARHLWVDHYGRWEREWRQDKPSLSGYGASTGLKRWAYKERELPGVSPAVIRFLLPLTLFGSISDLGYQLPPIHEGVEVLEMPAALAQQVQEADQKLLSAAMQWLEDGDPTLFSLWFSTLWRRPAAAFRPESIQAVSKRTANAFSLKLEAVAEHHDEHGLRWLPKERRLAEIVSADMQAGRKTLVYVEQTGERDIRARLKHAIECLAGGRPPRVEILSAGDMKPAARERWIKEHVQEMDVLLVNPKLVETGLDLIQFSRLVFYETSLSLYTLWQSLCRVWRLGQDKQVHVTFLAYKDSLEEKILARMGEKKKAAQMLYGKEAAGVLVEVDDTDLQRELIRSALEGSLENSTNLSGSLFTEGERTKSVMVDDSPMGSLTASSPPLPTLAQDENDWSQMTLFGESVPISNGRKRRK